MFFLVLFTHRVYNTRIIAVPTKGVLWEEGRKRSRFLSLINWLPTVLFWDCCDTSQMWLKNSILDIRRVTLEEVWALLFLVIWVEIMVTFLLKLPLERGICKYQATFGMLFLQIGPVLQSAEYLQFSGTVFFLWSCVVLYYKSSFGLGRISVPLGMHTKTSWSNWSMVQL